jgi:hypothetical protein
MSLGSRITIKRRLKMKIPYEIDEHTGECMTKCPLNKQSTMTKKGVVYSADIYVGSFACTEECSFFVDKNKIERLVTCGGVE